MAISTLSDYFGTTLGGLINTNAATIATNLGVSTATIQNPDGCLAAIIKKTKAWLEVAPANATDNGVTVVGFGTDGAPTKVTGSGDREYQLGFQYQITFWIPDTTDQEVPPNLVI